MMRNLFIYTFSLLFCSLAGCVFAQSNSDTLIIATAGSAPFIISQDANAPEGIAVDIWKEIAEQNEWNYKYKSYVTVKDALAAIKLGEADVAIGPISITSNRVKEFGFSQPYYNSSLTLASHADDKGIWASVKPFFSLKLLYAVGGFLLILAIVGTFFWVAERKVNPEEFPASPLKGIGNGMWLAIVTMSTVGYGDMAPKSVFGRVVAGTWIVLAIIFATSMVAGIASVLTLSGIGSDVITNVEQLAKKKVVTVKGSPAEEFIIGHGAKIVKANDLPSAIELLNKQEVDAVVYDRPQLLYYEEMHPLEDIYIAKAEYYKQGYGFAFNKGDTLVYQVNQALLSLAENQKVKSILEQYLGDENQK